MPDIVAAEGEGKLASLRKGATSLEFALNTDGGTFGGSLAARQHFSPSLAGRLEVRASASSGSFVHSDADSFTSIARFDEGGDTDAHSYGVTLQALWYPVRRDPIALAIGIGPFVDWYASDITNQGISSDTGGGVSARRTSDTEATAIGAALDFGVEWFFVDGFSVNAKSGLHAGWQDASEDGVTYYYDQFGNAERIEHHADIDRFNLDTVNFSLGVAAYF